MSTAAPTQLLAQISAHTKIRPRSPITVLHSLCSRVVPGLSCIASRGSVHHPEYRPANIVSIVANRHRNHTGRLSSLWYGEMSLPRSCDLDELSATRKQSAPITFDLARSLRCESD